MMRTRLARIFFFRFCPAVGRLRTSTLLAIVDYIHLHLKILLDGYS